MNKKIIILIIAVIIVASLGVGIWFISSNNKPNTTDNLDNKTMENENNKETQEEKDNDKEATNDKKVAIIYFSATGNTKKVAEYLKTATGGDLIEIVPKEKYTASDLDYGNNNSRASKEQNNANARPEIANNINTNSYDIIYLGYPIWWGDVPKIILTFLDSYKLDGKTIIPFCTSASTPITDSMNTLKNYKENITWLEGNRFSASVSQNEVSNWVNNINY